MLTNSLVTGSEPSPQPGLYGATTRSLSNSSHARHWRGRMVKRAARLQRIREASSSSSSSKEEAFGNVSAEDASRVLQLRRRRAASEHARRFGRAHGSTMCERAVLEDVAKSEVAPSP